MEKVKKEGKRWKVFGIILAVWIVITGGGYFAYETSRQPNIQPTSFQFQTVNDPKVARVVNQGLVREFSSFDYAAQVPGKYMLVFTNPAPILSSKTVSLSYAAGEQSKSISIELKFSTPNPALIEVDLSKGQRLQGNFRVTSVGLDINAGVDFEILGSICSQAVSFKFELVNSGEVDGYATIGLLVDGVSSEWSNKYFVKQGEILEESGAVILDDCQKHTYKIVNIEQSKA